MKNGPKTFTRFWTTGSVDPSFSAVTSPHPNPLFYYTHNNDFFNLHYGSNPTDGFHLALGYLDLDAKKSPGFPDIKRKNADPDVEASQFEFGKWAKSFHRFFQESIKESPTTKISIYSCYADALDFCVALGSLKTRDITRIDFGCAGFSARPFIFTKDYLKRRDTRVAPILFDVIETSNLSDHCGLLNIVSCTSCLLKPSISSVLSTDSLVSKSDSREGFDSMKVLEELTSVDPQILFSVLGISVTAKLYPWNTTNTKTDEVLSSVMGSKGGIVQRNMNMLWRPALFFDPKACEAVNLPLRMQIDEDAFAELFLQVYKKLFQCEVICFLYY